MIEPKKDERGEGKASRGVVAMEVESKPRRRRTMRVSHATAPRRRALAHQKHMPTYVRNVKTTRPHAGQAQRWTHMYLSVSTMAVHTIILLVPGPAWVNCNMQCTEAARQTSIGASSRTEQRDEG